MDTYVYEVCNLVLPNNSTKVIGERSCDVIIHVESLCVTLELVNKTAPMKNKFPEISSITTLMYQFGRINIFGGV